MNIVEHFTKSKKNLEFFQSFFSGKVENYLVENFREKMPRPTHFVEVSAPTPLDPVWIWYQTFSQDGSDIRIRVWSKKAESCLYKKAQKRLCRVKV